MASFWEKLAIGSTPMGHPEAQRLIGQSTDRVLQDKAIMEANIEAMRLKEGGQSWGGSQQAAAANLAELKARQGQYGVMQTQGLQYGRDARGQQMAGLGMTGDAAGMYRNAALGLGPSVAQNQLAQGLAAAQAQQASIAAGARGGGANFAAAQLAAGQQMGGLAAQANMQAAQLRAQEQLNAMQGYGQLAGQYGQQAGAMRGQDYGLASMGQAGVLDVERMKQAQMAAELDARMRAGAIAGGMWQTAMQESNANQRAQRQTEERMFGMGLGAVSGAAGFAASRGGGGAGPSPTPTGVTSPSGNPNTASAAPYNPNDPGY